MTPEVTTFDLYGPLPGLGITVLEASAGTGKTYTLAALATRLIAEHGVSIERILAVTFTRLATAELRDRVRSRLVTAEERLGLLVDSGCPPPEDDELVQHLARADLAEVRLRRNRLADALAEYDMATITTTHGFCHLVLAGLGVAGRVSIGAELVEDVREVIDDAVDDLYLRGMLTWGGLDFSLPVGRQIAVEAVANAETPLAPAPPGSAAEWRRRFAVRARTLVAGRLLDANFLTYDDLLGRLRDALVDAHRGDLACAILRARYSVVLVDEFQDTDPVQWDVVRRAFGAGDRTLVLIGDPKQAIYAFRGADVYAYLDAARQAARRYTLMVNWRSDEGLLTAYDALLDPLLAGHPDIPYRKVSATAAHRRPGIEGAPHGEPLRFRLVHTSDALVRLTQKSGKAQKDSAVQFIAGDVAADIVQVLGSGAELVAWAEADTRRRRLEAGDLAVLVRTNRQAIVVQSALRAAGVPAVVGGSESVLATRSADDWLRLLEAIEQPSSRPRAAAVALTPFIGMTVEQVASGEEAMWEELHARLHRWADVLRRRGVATLARFIMADEGLPGRMLAEVNGERRLTDLAHIAELLHAEAAAGQLGAPALRTWLGRRIEESTDDLAGSDERSRRLESDADAVQVLTVHRAKGLEFGVVYCPYLWDPGQTPGLGHPLVYHDAQDGYRRILDVGGGDDRAAQDRHRIALEEQRGEDLRLLYVALTRARHQAVVWWVRAHHCEQSPLGRLLMFREPDGTVRATGPYAPRDADVQGELESLAARAEGQMSVERVTAPSGGRWAGTTPPPDSLAAARFSRDLDLSWRRASYTGITAATHDEQVGSEPEAPGTTDEPQPPEFSGATGLSGVTGFSGVAGFSDVAGASGRARSRSARSDGSAESAKSTEEFRRGAVPSVLGPIPGGAEIGSFAHEVLERVNFAAVDLESEVGTAVAVERSKRPLTGTAAGLMTAGLLAAIRTPLGPLAENRRLADISRADRLDEVGFELPLVGGDRPTGRVLVTDIGTLLSRHVAPGDPLDGYAERLSSPLLTSHLRGYLTGSLDLVIRVRQSSGEPRFIVIDYKTNRLAARDEDLTTWHYRPEALAAEMQRSHYPLQALFYSVALHRYLRWRLNGYDPDVHLGGVLYLFVRGMVGPDTPAVDGTPCGVFGWRTPAGLVTGVSDLFASGLVPA
jgi:exodeoxyribonuclease V beta subunit